MTLTSSESMHENLIKMKVMSYFSYILEEKDLDRH